MMSLNDTLKTRGAAMERYVNDVKKLKELFHFPDNQDVIFREVSCADFRLCVIQIDGMTRSSAVEDFILRAAQSVEQGVSSANRLDFLLKRCFSVGQVKKTSDLQEIVSSVLSGMAAAIVEGADEAALMDVRGFEHRAVSQSMNESVVLGSQEGFVESLRTNLTLLHRYLQTPDFMVEFVTAGTKAPLKIALLSLRGVTDESALSEARRRIADLKIEAIHGAGHLQQLIEDNPMAVTPQMLMTERPDRAVAALTAGQFVILADTSCYALIAPCCLFALLQSSDDAFARWQHGSYMRVVRMIGTLFALLLPGLYVALTTYHTHLIPMALLSSIAETRVNVPFPVLFEVAIMEVSFFMIHEANLRIPSQIGASIGIVGALVLGQAAAEASVISPILIIIIALSGLGCYCMPNYAMTVSLILYRLILVVLSAALGLYGITLGLFLSLCQLSALRSFGVPYLAPLAPKRPHNPDLLIRCPAKWQRDRMFFAGRKKGAHVRKWN